jgi:uncharacterized membrane protein
MVDGDGVLGSQPGVRIGPVAILFPVALLGLVVLFDLGAMVGGFGFPDLVGRWILGTGLLAGILVLTVALVDLTGTISGTRAHRARGAAGSALATMVIVFSVVWFARLDGHLGGSPALWLLEVVGVCAGAVAAWFARDVIAPVTRPVSPRLGLGDL